MATDIFPRPDADFNNWLNPIVTFISANAVTYGLDAAAVAALNGAMPEWTQAYTAYEDPATATTAATARKNAARAALETLLRPLIKQLQASPQMTDTIRASIGLHVHAAGHAPAPVPATPPLATVDTSRRLSHIIDFRDAIAPQRRAKPAGVRGCEVWAKVGGPPPASLHELTYLATDTATPYLVEYDVAQGGQTVYYWLRWVNTRGEHGPWSEVVAATIPG